MDADQARVTAITAALGDSSSEYYKGLCQLLESATARERSAKARSSYVTVPFHVDDVDLSALEAQFGVVLRTRGATVRSRLTPRVAALLYVLEAALLEHAGSGSRSVLLVDGDIVSLAALGYESRVVERTNCHARAACGYFQEDEALRRLISGRNQSLSATSGVLLHQVLSGGGENYHHQVRVDAPVVDSIVFNHFKTPVNIHQAAWLVKKRGGVGYGAFPFQLDMLTADEGELACFPGKFYVDRSADVITLVPRTDASMSISHPYVQLMEFVKMNGVVVDGTEFLCEKYMSVKGIMYYTLVAIDADYEAPEILRSHYYDAEKAKLTSLTFPKVRFSGEGVPVGFERCTVQMLSSRLDKVLARAVTSRSEIVKPDEVYSALMDYNNMTLNTLDTAVVSERMDEFQENDVAVAIALHVNWRRHAARGTLKTLLSAVKARMGAKDTNVFKFAGLALSAWWSRPHIGKGEDGSIPYEKITDWCGNDFSVVISEVDPWVEVAQDTSVPVSMEKAQFPWLPLVPGVNSCRASRASDGIAGTVVDKKLKVARVFSDSSSVGFGVARTGATTALVTETCRFKPAIRDFTDVKNKLFEKLVRDQAAAREAVCAVGGVEIQMTAPPTIPVVAVPLVDPVSAIRSDLDQILGGLPEMDSVKIGYRLAEVDVNKVTRGNIQINDAKRAIPKQRFVRKPKVDAGVEGNRIQSSHALLGALFKRNIGTPANRGFIDLDLAPDKIVDRVVNTCFRSDWKEIVEKHIHLGMWEPNEEDVANFVSNVDEKKARKMVDEFFSEGLVRLDRWLLMAKGKVKPKREAGSDSKISHSQTIMFLEQSSVNAIYSSIMRRVNICLNECLRENVKINPQWSAAESEDWYNSLEPIRSSCASTYSYSVDSSDYDRSQEHPALQFEMAFHRRMGLTKERFKIWEESHGLKRAVNMMFGILISNVLGGISGDWKTLYRNGIIQTAATIVSAGLQRDEIVTLEVKGDDVDLETTRPIKVESAVARMNLSFNLASKFNTNDVRYFCKSFRLKVMGRWLEIADPWARVQSLCTPVWIDDVNVDMMERWVSLCSDLRHYDNEIAIEAVAQATQKFYGLPIVPYGMCRALSCMIGDSKAYMNFFLPPEMSG